MAIKEFDDVLQYMGGFGTYQYILLVTLGFGKIMINLLEFGQLFLTLTPPHWCKPNLDLLYLNELSNISLTAEDVKSLTIPFSNQEFSKCQIYDVNFTEILLKKHRWPNELWPQKECQNGWNYNFSHYYPTITSDLDWVCSNDWKVPMAQSFFFIGSLIGIPFFGLLADSVGRLPIAVLVNILAGAFGLVSIFADNFWSFAVARFFTGTCFNSAFTILYMLTLEYVCPEYRTLLLNIPDVLFSTLSMASLPWIALYFHEWKSLGVFMALPHFLCIMFPLFLPESARWLSGRGKTEKTLLIIKKIADINDRPLSPEVTEDLRKYLKHQSLLRSRRVGFSDLFKTPVLRKRIFLMSILWAINMVVFDAFVRNTENLSIDFFFSFCLLSVVEVPSTLIILFLMEKIGRKQSMIWPLLICTFVCMLAVGSDESDVIVILLASTTGRLISTATFDVASQYTMEILPTDGRASGSSLIQTVGIGATFVSPYIIYLSKYLHGLPYFVLGLLCLIAAIVCLFLPETLGETIPDSLEDGENFCSQQPMLFIPPKKTNYYGTMVTY